MGEAGWFLYGILWGILIMGTYRDYRDMKMNKLRRRRNDNR